MQNKRFIAAASCPQCKAQDKIYTYNEAGKKWRACAQCSFVESFTERPHGSPEELPTRVNQQRAGEAPLEHETPVESVVWVDLQKPGTKPSDPAN